MTTRRNAVGWFELYVADMTRAKTFYKAVFQKEMQELPVPDGNMQMCAFTWADGAPGAAGALVKSAHAGPGTGGMLVYFSCADCAVETARVETAGGNICQPKRGIDEYGFIAIVQDSEGNTIGLHSLQ
ncbi:MAG: VOC family protein [Polaromonas sp.]